MEDDAVKLARRVLEQSETHRAPTISQADTLAKALLAAVEENERLKAGHALLCVVAMMDPDETTGTVKVFRDCMPRLARLFTPLDGDALYLNEAVRRFVDIQPSATKAAP